MVWENFGKGLMLDQELTSTIRLFKRIYVQRKQRRHRLDCESFKGRNFGQNIRQLLVFYLLILNFGCDRIVCFQLCQLWANYQQQQIELRVFLLCVQKGKNHLLVRFLEATFSVEL